MRSSSLAMAPLIVLLTALLFLKGTFGKLECEKLSPDTCAFAISSSGKRCSLETRVSNDRSIAFECKTSDIMASVGLREHVESNDCINSCGVERATVGISTDKFLEPQFSKKLCSQDCQLKCLNIVDLYSSLALAEGKNLSAVCEALGASSHRKMEQLPIQSSGALPRRQKTMQTLNHGSSTETDAVQKLNHGVSGVNSANSASSTLATKSDAAQNLKHESTESGVTSANAASSTLATESDAAQNLNHEATKYGVTSGFAASSTLATKSDAAHNLNRGAIESGVALTNAASITLAAKSDAAQNLNHGAINSGVDSAKAASSNIATKSDAARNLNHGVTESGVASANAASNTIATKSDPAQNLNHGTTESGVSSTNAASSTRCPYGGAEAPIPSVPYTKYY